MRSLVRSREVLASDIGARLLVSGAMLQLAYGVVAFDFFSLVMSTSLIALFMLAVSWNDKRHGRNTRADVPAEDEA